jgi:LytS/YehU family sensor histidine kinase
VVVPVTAADAGGLWRAAVAGADTAGTWREDGRVVLAALAAASDGSFGVISRIERQEALGSLEPRLRKDRIAAYLLFAALVLTAALALAGIRASVRRRRAELATRTLEARLARAELEALRVQIRPHFLFNTLNTVVGLVDSEPRVARSVVERLSALLRVALRADADTEVELRQELEILSHYTAIQETRFRGRLTIGVRAEPGTGDALVPSLILQPLVENAIQHGTAPRAAGGRVDVRARIDGDSLVLEVDDDGVGIRPDYVEGIGVSNTKARLESLYDRHEFVVQPRPEGGTRVHIELPLRRHRAASPAMPAAAAVRGDVDRVPA